MLATLLTMLLGAASSEGDLGSALADLVPPAADPVAERVAQAEARLEPRVARVIVVPWPQGRVTHADPLLGEVVRDRLGRADAVLADPLDLHQAGRRRPGLPPAAQPGRVTDDELAAVRADLRRLADAAARRPDDLALVGALAALEDRIGFNDRPATRRVLFELAVAVGSAAHGARQQVPPFYGQVGAGVDNLALYRAAAMLWEERELGVDVVTSLRPGGELGRALDAIVAAIDAGVHAPLPLALHEGGTFDLRAFAREHHRVVVNGLERVVGPDGLLQVPRGRVDVFVEHAPGVHGLSERVEVRRLDDRVWFLREAARQEVATHVGPALLAVPGDRCPVLPAPVAEALGVYAALHPRDDVFVAIPERDRADRPRLWSWHREEGALHAVLDVDRGFPVRFALVAGVGVEVAAGAVAPAAAAQGPPAVDEVLSLQPASTPAGLALRAHLGRLMLGAGFTLGPAIAPAAQGRWVERFAAGGRELEDETGARALATREVRAVGFGEAGVVLRRLAPLGLGPRLAVRVAGSEVPRRIDLTLHAGATADPGFGKRPLDRRVVAILDLDLYAGLGVPYGDTLLRGADGHPWIVPLLGVSVGAGTTF